VDYFVPSVNIIQEDVSRSHTVEYNDSLNS